VCAWSRGTALEVPTETAKLGERWWRAEIPSEPDPQWAGQRTRQGDQGDDEVDEGSSGLEYKELTVPLAHRKRMFESSRAFARRVIQPVNEAVSREGADGWEPEDPIDFETLHRAGKIHWKTSFNVNPLGDMNKAVSATVRLKRPIRTEHA
jgi:hypothetical protein